MRLMEQAPAFYYRIGIDPADIDFMGHVNNASYLKWVQEAVISHWRKIAPADAIAEHLWVALKHEITYRKPTFLDDDVIVTVLLQKVQGARAFYEPIIRRGEEVQIGSASGRERVCQYGEISGVAGSLKK